MQGFCLEALAGQPVYTQPGYAQPVYTQPGVTDSVKYNQVEFRVSQIQGGKIKGVAVTSARRLASLPQVPTAVEAGLKGYDLDSWFALYAPAGAPPEVVQVLNTEVNRILQTPEARKKAEDSGTGVQTMTPAELGAFTQKELAYWGKVIKGARIGME